jgi:hypothetical protein
MIRFNRITALLLLSFSIVTSAGAVPPVTKTYGGGDLDLGRAIQRTADGGLILAGYTTSFGAGAEDFYLVKTDATGNFIWDQSYGGAARDICLDVAQTSDGGYILAGYTGVPFTNYDAYVVRVDAQGNFLWDNQFGGAERDEFHAVQQTADGGFILCGENVSASLGHSLYLVRIDAAGDLVWEQIYGSGDDHGEAVEVTTDGGFIVGGWRGDGSTFAEFDAWVFKTDSGGNIEWQRELDSSIDDRVYTVLQTSDGGFAAAGQNAGTLALWRFDALGTLDWQQGYGGPSSDYANDMVQTADGGFLVGGNTTRDSQLDQYLVKTDAAGALETEEVVGDVRWEFCYGVDVTSEGDYALFLALVEGSVSPSGIGDVPPLATHLGLRVFPNPVHFDTRFSFQMPEAGQARLAVYDVRGARVATVVDGRVGAGDRSVFWSPRSAGRTLPSGVYFARLEVAGQVETQKFVIAR